MSEENFLPPASFTFLVESIMMQTQMNLGLFQTEEAEEEPDQELQNLEIARHSIDLLAILQEKTRGNLTAEEHRTLENGLTELRFRFVQVSEELARQHAPEPESPLIFNDGGGKGARSA